jgi:hypothetical protein
VLQKPHTHRILDIIRCDARQQIVVALAILQDRMIASTPCDVMGYKMNPKVRSNYMRITMRHEYPTVECPALHRLSISPSSCGRGKMSWLGNRLSYKLGEL